VTTSHHRHNTFSSGFLEHNSTIQPRTTSQITVITAITDATTTCMKNQHLKVYTSCVYFQVSKDPHRPLDLARKYLTAQVVTDRATARQHLCHEKHTCSSQSSENTCLPIDVARAYLGGVPPAAGIPWTIPLCWTEGGPWPAGKTPPRKSDLQLLQ
jgi:hypothetical protein